MVFTLSSMVSFALLAFLLPNSLSAVPQNTTVDDSDQARITYSAEINWSHDPLQGYEQFFVNGTRSYTYLPGAAALFNFTGIGIYLQGPYSNDQAQRSVTLDGQDMGTFAAYALQRLPSEGTSAVFWGKGGLEDTVHTVVVTHGDTADKILVMDAWIFEADSSESQGTDTTTAGAVDASNIAEDNSPSMISTRGIILAATVPLILLFLCVAGFFLFRKRRQRNQQRQLNAIKEKMFPSSRHRMRLSQSLYSASTTSDKTSSHKRSASATFAPEHSSGKPSAEFAAGGRTLLSRPLHYRPRAVSDTYHTEGTLGLSNHPLFVATPSIASVSSEAQYPTQPPYAGAPILFFEQRPDPVPSINSDYTPRPIVRTPTPLSPFRRLSSSFSGLAPGFPDRAPSRSSNGGHGAERRMSVLSDFKYNTTTSPGTNVNLDLEVERAASPLSRDRDSYFSYPRSHYVPSSPTRLSSIPAASTGFARQSADLGELSDFKYDIASLSVVDVLGRLAGAVTLGSDFKRGGQGKVDRFDDE